MDIYKLIQAEQIECCTEIGSKKRLLEKISELLSKSAPQLTQNEIFDALINREKLGSTGLGKGVAIPHGRVKPLEKAVCSLIKLDEPVDFDASDNEPVDLIVGLLVPEDSTEEHLQILSSIAELFSNPGFCNVMRSCKTGECLLQAMSQGISQRISA